MQGKFITLEGGEGAGKSTQIERLKQYISDCGIKVISTREVGGAPSAEEIRIFWLNREEKYWDPLTEVLLIMAARREHLVQTVWPALASGTWVISDRFVDSSRAYQGVGFGLGIEKIDAIYREIAGDFWPDLTLFLDVDVDRGLERVASRKGIDDRYQQKKQSFHAKLRQAYHDIAANEPKRFHVIDANLEEDRVSQLIRDAVSRHFKISPPPKS
ncbi:MAG: dTMP kinase [Alphaproteobacteria bacterium]|nr:dTMP kinase [Alphaproteobacteria bacterium]